MQDDQSDFYGYPIADLKEIVDNLGENNQKFSGKTVLIAGSGGFIGHSLLLYFLYINRFVVEIPVNIIAIDAYVGRNKPQEIIDSNLRYIDHDICFPLGLKLINTPIHFIYNCTGRAAPTGNAGYENFPIETLDVSYLATRNLLELALQHNAAIVNFSSSEVLSGCDKLPCTEECLPKIHTQNKRAPYDSGKIVIEVLSWIFRKKYNVNAKVVRLFNCVGYFRKDDFRVIPIFMNKAINNQEMPVILPGTQTRQFSFFTDIITGINLVILNGKDLLYHLGSSDEQTTIIDLAYKIEKICGKTDLVRLIPTPEVYLHEPQKRQALSKKAEFELGYRPKVKIDEMLQRIYEYAKVAYKNN